MSRHRHNLYILSTHNDKKKKDGNTKPSDTVFQQLHQAKKSARTYHGEHIKEKQFKSIWGRSHLPLLVPSSRGDSSPDPVSRKDLPWSALTFHQFERRLDLAIYRACFAPSIKYAFKIITGGYVKLNGHRILVPACELSDGDIVEVHPSAVGMLRNTTGEPEKSEAQEGRGVEVDSDESEEGTQSEDDCGYGIPPSRSPQEEWGVVKDERTFVPDPFMQPWTFVPEYLEVNYNMCSFVFLRSPMIHPNGDTEIPSPYPPSVHSLVHAFYSKRVKVQGTHAYIRWMKAKSRNKPPLHF